MIISREDVWKDDCMKTFTVTLHHSNNYGALLQAYALQQVQRNMGIDNTVFEYPYPDGFYDQVDLRHPKSALAAAVININKRMRKKAIMRRAEGFRRFHRERMKLSRVYRSMDDLRSDEIDADVLIAGSDQVWRFSGNKEFIPARFLDFGKPGVKKISYAASIEKLNYTERQKDQVREWLADYRGISLREESARAYISEIIGRDADRVLDPVFLLTKEQWAEIAVPPVIKEPYILCYQVQKCPGMQEVADLLKKKTGYRTVAVLPGSVKYIRTDDALFDVTPEEFLGLYMNASIVVSGSFHGTAFGYLFGKPTYALVRRGSASRIKELVKMCGTEPFCIDDTGEIPLSAEFDAAGVGDRLAAQRKESFDYLNKHINNR